MVSASAWDGDAVPWKISSLDIVGGTAGAPGNFTLRVRLKGVSAICATASDKGWGFVNGTDANYKGILAMLMMAQATGKTVYLYSNKKVIGENSYCEIGYVTVLTE